MCDYRKELGGTFDTSASLYNRMRPGYTDELYRAIFDYISIDKESRVVEVGSGTGQATLPILKTGCELTAVEYGKNLSSMLKDRYQEYDGLSVITGKFEDVKLQENAYDLVFSATAFHWVPEDIGYPKVYSILKPAPSSRRADIRPSTLTVPAVGLKTPVMILSMVDLPDPLVPMIPTVSPFFTCMDTSLRA